MRAETTITTYKSDYIVKTNADSKTGISYPYNKEHYFTSKFPINVCGCFICGYKDHFNSNDCPKGLNNHSEWKLFLNYMWENKPHTKKRSKNENYNIPHETVNNLNSSHIEKN